MFHHKSTAEVYNYRMDNGDMQILHLMVPYCLLGSLFRQIGLNIGFYHCKLNAKVCNNHPTGTDDTQHHPWVLIQPLMVPSCLLRSLFHQICLSIGGFHHKSTAKVCNTLLDTGGGNLIDNFLHQICLHIGLCHHKPNAKVCNTPLDTGGGMC